VWQSENDFVGVNNDFVGVNNDFTEQAFYSSYRWNMKVVFVINSHRHSVRLISGDFVVEHVVGGMSGLFETFETMTHFFLN
jgi:hypothetical protein